MFKLIWGCQVWTLKDDMMTSCCWHCRNLSMFNTPGLSRRPSRTSKMFNMSTKPNPPPKVPQPERLDQVYEALKKGLQWVQAIYNTHSRFYCTVHTLYILSALNLWDHVFDSCSLTYFMSIFLSFWSSFTVRLHCYTIAI